MIALDASGNLPPPPKLQPCPFCAKPLTLRWRQINPRAGCKTEGCFGAKMPAIALDDETEIAAWNTREQPAASQPPQARDATQEPQPSIGSMK